MRTRRASWIAGIAWALSAALATAAGATSLGLAFDLQGEGLSWAADGVGLENLGSGAETLTVDIGGPVAAALLYWAGRDDRACPQDPPESGNCIIPFEPYKDQELIFDGNPITGMILGTEVQPAPVNQANNNIGYLHDVTAIVEAKGPGVHDFTVEDGNLALNLRRLNGAALLVIFTNPGDPGTYRIQVFHGLDFAYGNDPTPSAQVTDPVTFNHGAEAVARLGELLIFCGDATPGRPDRIDISNNPSVVNGLDGDEGPSWDTDFLPVDVPAGVVSTTVQLFSEPAGRSNPDSLLWELAGLRLPLPQEPPSTGEEGCTPGYWKQPHHFDSWGPTGYSPGQPVNSVFSAADLFLSLATKTLAQTLDGGGGPGTLGAAKILLRAAVAALLNAAHPDVSYPRTESDVIADVNAALASGNRGTMLSLAGELDEDNNLGCPLD